MPDLTRPPAVTVYCRTPAGDPFVVMCSHGPDNFHYYYGVMIDHGGDIIDRTEAKRYFHQADRGATYDEIVKAAATARAVCNRRNVVKNEANTHRPMWVNTVAEAFEQAVDCNAIPTFRATVTANGLCVTFFTPHADCGRYFGCLLGDSILLEEQPANVIYHHSVRLATSDEIFNAAQVAKNHTDRRGRHTADVFLRWSTADRPVTVTVRRKALS